MSNGQIIHYDEEKNKSAAQIAWRRDDATTTTITLNGEPVGRELDGFAAVIQALERLPERSIVDVAIGIRTRPPFSCPLVWKGHRHFERSGYEPYAAYYPWLLEVAERRKLVIQWIPDEQPSTRDCENARG